VDAAFDGDTIVVGDGMYSESVAVTKSLTSGRRTGPTGRRQRDDHDLGDNTTVSGLTITGNSTEYGIISNCCSGCTITGNVISDKGTGIRFIAKYLGGLDFLPVKNVRVEGNTLTDVREGISADTVTDSTINNNTISGEQAPGSGIAMVRNSRNVVSGNTITGFTCGFSMSSVQNCRFDHNLVMDNTYLISATLESLSGCTFYANSFVNNAGVNTGSLEASNTWNSPEPVTYTYDGVTYTGPIGNYGEQGSLSTMRTATASAMPVLLHSSITICTRPTTWTTTPSSCRPGPTSASPTTASRSRRRWRSVRLRPS
jgi:parallel beta-helix repeat protein